MNRVYRLKFSKVLQQMIAVSEISRGHDRNSGKANSSRISAKLIKPSLLALLITVSLSSYSLASGLQGMEVISGSAEIKKEGVITTIKNSPDTVLNWQTFDIAKDETVHFAQENSKSTAFNKVIGEKPSDLQGKLTSNGNVFLINPNGIVIGKDAVIDTNSFIGSTLNTSNEELKNNKFTLSSENQKNRAGIVNHGKVKVSQKGSVTLIGNSVKNNGIIEAKEGNVLLQAGSKIELSDISNPSITYSITNFGQDVMNVGDVISNNVTLSGFNVSNDGNINISNLDNSQGSITINAKNEFNLNGKLDSSNKKGKANNIKINSPVSNINGIIDLSGSNEGGNVILGGKVNLSENSTINTSAMETGNAGNITISYLNKSEGKIKATGGNVSGNGGYINVNNLPINISKDINVSAPKGVSGGVAISKVHRIISDYDYKNNYNEACLYEQLKCISLSAFEKTPNLIFNNSILSIHNGVNRINRIGSLTLNNSKIFSYTTPFSITGEQLTVRKGYFELQGNFNVNLNSLNIHNSSLRLGDLVLSPTSNTKLGLLNITGNSSARVFGNISTKTVNVEDSYLTHNDASVSELYSFTITEKLTANNSSIGIQNLIGNINSMTLDKGLLNIGTNNNSTKINEIRVENGRFSLGNTPDINNIKLNNASLNRDTYASEELGKIKSINAHNSNINDVKTEKLSFTKDEYIEGINFYFDNSGLNKTCSYNFAEYYCLDNVTTISPEISGVKLDTNGYINIARRHTTSTSDIRRKNENYKQEQGDIILGIGSTEENPDLIVKVNGNLKAGGLRADSGSIKLIANDIGSSQYAETGIRPTIIAKGDIELLSYGNASVYLISENGNAYVSAHNDFLPSNIRLRGNANLEITAGRFFNPIYSDKVNNIKIKSTEIPYSLEMAAYNAIDIYSDNLKISDIKEQKSLDANIIRLYGTGLNNNSQGVVTSIRNNREKEDRIIASNLYIFDKDISVSDKNTILYDKNSNIHATNVCVNGFCRDGSIIEDSGFGEMKEITDPFYKEPTPVDIPTEDPASEDIPTEEPVSEDVPTEEPVSEDVPTEEPVSEEVPAEAPVSEDTPTEEPVSEDIPTEEPVSEDVPTEEPVSEDIPTEKNASKDTLFEEYEWIIPRVDGYGSNKNKERAIEYTKREEEFYNSIKNITDEKKRNELIKENKEYIERIKRHNIEYGRILGKALAYKNSAQSYKSGRELDSIQLFKDVADYGRQITFTVIPAVAAPATVVKAVAYDTAKKVIINGAFYYDESKESKESIKAKKLAKVVTEYGISTIEIMRDAEALHKVRNLKNTNSVLGGVISFAFDAYSDKIQSGIDYLENINKPKTNESTPYIMSHCKEASCRNSYEEEFNLAFSNGFKEALTEMDKDKKEYENAGFFHQVFNSKPETKYQNKADELLLELNVHVKETRKIVDDRMNEINSKK